MRLIHGHAVFGVELDGQSRCAHWHSELDIVAIRHACCGEFYACAQCHEELSGHEAAVWPKSAFAMPAILCGACGEVLAIEAYLNCSDQCPACSAPFNPGCRSHRHLYFED